MSAFKCKCTMSGRLGKLVRHACAADNIVEKACIRRRNRRTLGKMSVLRCKGDTCARVGKTACKARLTITERRRHDREAEKCASR